MDTPSNSFEEEQDPLIGEVVASRYKVLSKMGEGGMGTVYLAEHITIEKKVALKVLLPEYTRKSDLKERFLREAKAAASINHANIIDITDFGETPDGSVFFAMEFLDGADLSDAIKDGPMPWSRAKPIILQICRALGAAHSKNIVHRDMKPENVFLIKREGRPDFVKVLDFGIAKVSGMGDGDAKLTRTGMIFGTPEYMSPEQAQGHLPDQRVDIYAVGVILYELLTGEVPFKADTFMGILTKHIFENPMPPTQFKPELQIPIEAESVILRAMDKDRDERFSSMSEMAAAIQAVSDRLTRSTSDFVPSSPRKIPNTRDKKPVGPRTISGAPNQKGTAFAIDDDFPVSVGSNKGKIIGILLVLFLIAGGAVAFVLLNSKKSETKKKIAPHKPQKKAKPSLYAIALDSTPSGATIIYENKIIGKTPMELKLKENKDALVYRLELEGYQSFEQKIVADKNQTMTVNLIKKDVVKKPEQNDKKPEKTKIASSKKRKVKKKKKKYRINIAKKPEKKKPKKKTGSGDSRIDKGDLKNPFQ